MLRGLVRAYQLVVSPWFPRRCKYHPTCSEYAIVALTRHGAWRGTRLAVWRLLRCNPWSDGGVDDVPPRTIDGERCLVSGSVSHVSSDEASSARRCASTSHDH